MFDFQGGDKLARAQAKKLSGFKPEYLYTKVQMTAINSLQAFVGIITLTRSRITSRQSTRRML
ncbi:hypothetical protein F5Y10DRAFT_258081 [Nemania abortiva]|nr:hypothetical protein F5Y10DRAFT_258081 [Nemania abortiva]